MRQESRGVQRDRGSRLLALSRFSISCSKLSKAVSLSSSVIWGSVERIADMERFISSASLGPPKRALRASGLMGREEGVLLSAEGFVVVVVGVFSTLHFKRDWRLGSILRLCFVCIVVVGLVW